MIQSKRTKKWVCTGCKLNSGKGVPMQIQQINIHINETAIRSISDFYNAKEGYCNFSKKTDFVRYIGYSDKERYVREIQELDKRCRMNREKSPGYHWLHDMEKPTDTGKLQLCTEMYEKWEKHRMAGEDEVSDLPLPMIFVNSTWDVTVKKAYQKVLKTYRNAEKNITDSMMKNFGIKLLYWADVYFPRLFLNTKIIGKFPKVVYWGDIKKQEYMFLYFLVLTGCDVLYLNPEKDSVKENAGVELAALSCLADNPYKEHISMPKLNPVNIITPESAKSESVRMTTTESVKSESVRMTTTESAKLKPVRMTTAEDLKEESANVTTEKKQQAEPVKMTMPARPQMQAGYTVTVKRVNEPLSYEELAKFAASVVMIGVYNGEKECYKTGSGVMIHRDGYILTNFHVAQGGAFYGIRFEEEEEIFYTRDLIKYHPEHDLAILKVEKGRTPIPLYREEKPLVRGQQVVAIGSPLGLFNSVSDGIISGFRQFEETSMIQFTAPTSHGSSGGALIDRYGRLIGLITGGFDDGQNLNLAVDYKTIAGFAGGLFGK